MGQDLIIVNLERKEYVKNKWDEQFNDEHGTDYRLFHWFVITRFWFQEKVLATDDEHAWFDVLTVEERSQWKDRTDDLFDEFKGYFK